MVMLTVRSKSIYGNHTVDDHMLQDDEIECARLVTAGECGLFVSHLTIVPYCPAGRDYLVNITLLLYW